MAKDPKNYAAMYLARLELFEATPIEVWKEYLANGYSWAEAVNEELSYAETIES